MNEVTIEYINSVWLRVHCEPGTAKEIQDHFTFLPKNSHFMRRKFKNWDGKVKLFKLRGNRLYRGLEDKLVEFLENGGYTVIRPESTGLVIPDNLEEIFDKVSATWNIPKKYETRSYQKEAILSAIRQKRSIILSPTASGKSFIIYNILRFLNLKTLLIVPTTSLVNQMYNDFAEYSVDDPKWNVDEKCSKIMQGLSKEGLQKVTISTWQSIYLLDKKWLSQFDCVMVDEVHGAKAKSLTSLLENMEDCDWRFGFTGTLDGIDVNEMTLNGLFGPTIKVITTSELIEKGFLANIEIECLLLKYSKESCKNKGEEYQDEIKFLIGHEKRNDFIANLANKLPKTTLVLYQYVDSHGKILYDKIVEGKSPDTSVFYISGATSAEEREEIRQYVENATEKCIIVASKGTTAVGTNITTLFYIIFASPSKARIQTLQSIGRGLRKRSDKDKFKLFDIADDLRLRKKNNFTLNHFIERLKIYMSEKFKYKVTEIQLEKDG